MTTKPELPPLHTTPPSSRSVPAPGTFACRCISQMWPDVRACRQPPKTAILGNHPATIFDSSPPAKWLLVRCCFLFRLFPSFFGPRQRNRQTRRADSVGSGQLDHHPQASPRWCASRNTSCALLHSTSASRKDATKRRPWRHPLVATNVTYRRPNQHPHPRHRLARILHHEGARNDRDYPSFTPLGCTDRKAGRMVCACEIGRWSPKTATDDGADQTGTIQAANHSCRKQARNPS